ncbi:carboxylesterase [Diaporthe helianthi]|uniref:Carboxylic ester hydrolase n=1 Tax=Diaporthe helianthi TaxID=158607 RepID=A0A2P5HGR5_DIAHE|nr:carboxylesterase [Diaporthe helianthi]
MAALVKSLVVGSLFASTSAHAVVASSHTGEGFFSSLRTRSGPVVTVKNGSYEGLYSSEYDQDFFLGMRYSQPAERFSLAQPQDSAWDGTETATAYPPSCVGYGGDNVGYSMSEDCLFLNVVRPAGIDETAKLPVAVWIHGGGLYMGGSQDRRYNLSFIVQNSVDLGTPMIGVSINYRVSAFGFLAGSDVLEAGIANNGFRDQRLALQWLHENLKSFGGDKTKVTIWGESSGAESVSAQVLAYNGRDDGLFRAAIGQSGFGGVLSRFPGGANNTEAMDELYGLLVSNTSCASTANTSASLDCLRSLPFDDINAALNGTAAAPWPPMLDGDFIADFPVNQLRDGRFPQIPILIGTNTDEGSAFGQGRGPNGTGVNTDDEMRAAVEAILGPDAPAHTGKPLSQLVDEALALYPHVQAVGVPSLDKFPVIEPGDSIATARGLQSRRTGAFFGDFMFQYLRRRANIAWSNAGLPSYSYEFNVVSAGVPNYIGATHFAEVMFVFDNVNAVGYDATTVKIAEEGCVYEALAKGISNAWVNFVTGLDPNGAGLEIDGIADWPIYNATEGGGVGKTVLLDTNRSSVAWDSYRAEGINWMIENSLAVFGN